MESTKLINIHDPVIISNDANRIELKEIYHNNYNYLYYYGLKLSGSKEITKDCIQDLFIQFWLNPDQLNHVRSIQFYLLKCLRRRILKIIGKERRNNMINSFTYQSETAVKSVEEEVIENENDFNLEQKFVNARKELSVRQQEVLYLKYNLGYNYSMICEIMEIKYQSVRNLLSESIKLLRIKLDSENAII